MRSDEKTKRTPKKQSECCLRATLDVACSSHSSTHRSTCVVDALGSQRWCVRVLPPPTTQQVSAPGALLVLCCRGRRANCFRLAAKKNEGEYSRHQSDGDASGMLGPCPPVHEDEDVVIIAQAGAHYAETTRVVDRYYMTIMVFRVPVSDNTHLGTPNFKASDHRMACTTAKHTTTVFSMKDSLM